MSAAAPYLISWVFCMVIAGAIGSNKAQGGTGLVLGALFGPLGILLILISKPSIEVQAQRAEALDAARAQLRAQTGTPQPVDDVPPAPASPTDDPWTDTPMRRRTT